MAKKVRRVKKSKQTAAGTAADTSAERLTAPEAPLPASRSRQSSEEQFREDYAYVIRDLRQVLLLSVAMFALLIVLNLLLN